MTSQLVLDSAKLLREYEQLAEDRIKNLITSQLENNILGITVADYDVDISNNNAVAVAHFKLNGENHKLEIRVPREEFEAQSEWYFDAVREQIFKFLSNELAKKVFSQWRYTK